MRSTLVILALLFCSSTALAGSYSGHGDTGFNHHSKRTCCAEALALAGEHGTDDCRRAGGWPESDLGVRRGHCDWEVSESEGEGARYRCEADTSVACN